MSGILSGGSSSTDRGAQLGARQGLWNVFNAGMNAAPGFNAAGTGALNTVTGFDLSMLKPGRTQAMANAQPATQNVLDQSDAARLQAGNLGTGRVGGTAAINREAGATATKSMDDIVNQSLQTGRTAAAQDLTTISQVDLRQALANMGLSADAANNIMSNATDSRKIDASQQSSTAQGVGQMAQLAAMLMLA